MAFGPYRAFDIDTVLKFHGRNRQLWVIQWMDVPPTALIIGPVAPSGRVAATLELGLVVGTSWFDLYRPYSFRIALVISSNG